jgi:tripartite-type tricarboxylate transporter receptor subunit TctC
MKMRKACLTAFAALAVLGTAQPVQSQDWPQRPARIIVPFAAGGNADIIARLVAQPLGETFGQQFVVENRPGANGALAANMVARAPADGYTLLLAALPHIAIVPAMTKTPYDPVKDFAPISIVGSNPFVLLVHPSIPVNNVAEFVDYMRKHPNEFSYASAAVGSLSHLSMVLFLNRAGIEMTHVVYRGGALTMNDVIAGHISTYLGNLSEALPHATSGAVRLLAVSSERRIPQLPDVPTLIEAGFSGTFKTVTWNGLMAPAGTPKEIVNRIAQEVSRAVKDPKLAERFAGYGVDPVGNSPAEFAAQIAADIALWGEAVKIAGVQEK